MSTLKCQNCETGYLMPDCQIHSEELTKYFCNFCENEVIGVCCKRFFFVLVPKNSCKFQIPFFKIASEVNDLESEVTEAIEKCYGDDEPALKNVLDLYKNKFHPRHYLILILKWLLLNIYGKTKEFAYSILSPDQIEDKISFCTVS